MGPANSTVNIHLGKGLVVVFFGPAVPVRACSWVGAVGVVVGVVGVVGGVGVVGIAGGVGGVGGGGGVGVVGEG